MRQRVKLVRYNGVLYHPNFSHRRLRCIDLFNHTCQHCGKKQGDEYIAATGRKYKVILQAAHLDHDPWNKNARLIALCKQCHMRHDGPEHAKTRKRKAVEAMVRAGQTFLPGFEEKKPRKRGKAS
jgi:hypothetical protein